jgi:AcrR family transcriptional regulator
MKKQPEQQRATETFELILDVTARTLEDVGIDRLSTNLVCERAGLSPPALYRYFPNKYALLHELGRRLMQKQNELIPHWITGEVLAGSREQLQAALEGLLLDTFRVTKETVAGLWVTRALRAVPALARVRLDSHNEVAQAHAVLLATVLPSANEDELRALSRVSVELIYAAVEMLFDELPMDINTVAHMVSSMVASYLDRYREPPKPRARKSAAR